MIRGLFTALLLAGFFDASSMVFAAGVAVVPAPVSTPAASATSFPKGPLTTSDQKCAKAAAIRLKHIAEEARGQSESKALCDGVEDLLHAFEQPVQDLVPESCTGLYEHPSTFFRRMNKSLIKHAGDEQAGEAEDLRGAFRKAAAGARPEKCDGAAADKFRQALDKVPGWLEKFSELKVF